MKIKHFLCPLIPLLLNFNLTPYGLPPYTNEHISNPSGLFYQNVGQSRISNDVFTLLFYTNISFYQSKLKFIKCVHKVAFSFCDGNMGSYCSSKFNTIAHIIGHKSVL